MLKGQEKFLDEEHLQEFDTSNDFEQFMKDIDNEIKNSENSRYNFDDIWDKL